MVYTEQSYVDSLNVLVEKFLNPLRNPPDNEEIIPQDQIRVIFSSIETILKFNMSFCEELKSRFDNWEESHGVGDIFAKFAPYFKLYQDYINNHENALHILRCLTGSDKGSSIFSRKKKDKQILSAKALQIGKSKKFISLLQNIAKDTNMPLQGYLILPIQRIPRYKMLLAELKKNTDDKHPDYAFVSVALEKISEVADEINLTMKSTENANEIIALQTRFEEPIELLHYDRTLLKTGVIQALNIGKGKTEPKKYFFALFSNLLILCKESGSKLVLKAFMNIDEDFYIIGNTSSIDEVKSPRSNNHSFQIIAEGGNIWQIFFSNVAEKREVLDYILSIANTIYEDLLFEAIESECPEVIQKLCATTCSFDKPNEKSGLTPLMACVDHETLDCMKVLVERAKVDLNAQTKDGETALILSASRGFSDGVLYLLKKGANANIKDHSDYTAAMHIANEKLAIANERLLDPKAMKVLLKHSDLNIQTAEGHTFLMIACMNGNQTALSIAFEHALKVDSSLIDHEGNNLLMHCVKFDNPDLLKEILMLGVNVNLRNNNGETALIIAAKKARAKSVQYLLENGADPLIEDNVRFLHSCDFVGNKYFFFSSSKALRLI
jgi:ankyrin repeat protein